MTGRGEADSKLTADGRLLVGLLNRKQRTLQTNSLKKYYNKQNKLVSNRLYRKNYIEVDDCMLKVFESSQT